MVSVFSGCNGGEQTAQDESWDKGDTPAGMTGSMPKGSAMKPPVSETQEEEQTEGTEMTGAKEESEQSAAAKDPEIFKVKFECSNGEFVVECHRDWAPIGAERFYQLAKSGFFDEARFFRVVPDFVVQFGIAADPEIQAEWRNKPMKDEAVKASNLRGTLTFAKSAMPNSRTTQLFINLKDNTFLDNQGFSAFGKIIRGMDVVDSINDEYREKPDQQMIQQRGNEYLVENFPNLDYIKKAVLIE